MNTTSQIVIDLEELRGRVRACRGRYAELATRSGLSLAWISKFGRGEFSPRVATLVALMDALEQMNQAA